jgi:DNA repair protein RecO (recombination protein O)
MEWRDEGVLLSVQPHGESAAIIEVFTAAHGRHAGVVRGGTGRRLAPVLQVGAQLDLTWRARLDSHIGTFTVEPLRARTAVLSDRLALAGLSAVCALTRTALPARDPHPELWSGTVDLLDRIVAEANWPAAYLVWEVGLLDELGFGLDLARCAVTGAAEDLAYVSPRTGRAVSRAAAKGWEDRLLPLPDCLRGGAAGIGDPGLLQGLAVTGHFLTRELPPLRHTQTQAQGQASGLPQARARLLGLLAGRAN